MCACASRVTSAVTQEQGDTAQGLPRWEPVCAQAQGRTQGSARPGPRQKGPEAPSGSFILVLATKAGLGWAGISAGLGLGLPPLLSF